MEIILNFQLERIESYLLKCSWTLLLSLFSELVDYILNCIYETSAIFHNQHFSWNRLNSIHCIHLLRLATSAPVNGYVSVVSFDALTVCHTLIFTTAASLYFYVQIIPRAFLSFPLSVIVKHLKNCFHIGHSNNRVYNDLKNFFFYDLIISTI